MHCIRLFVSTTSLAIGSLILFGVQILMAKFVQFLLIQDTFVP